MQNLSNNNFKNKLYKLLERDSRLWDKEKKELNETLLKNLTDKLDEQLLNLLLSDKQAKEKFFLKIKDLFVFKVNEFKFFIDENKLDNSYTQYKNRIGLKAGSKLLSERDEVVLDWPFKDCVLAGGMTKEGQKRNEIFFNEVLAKDEIDRLYEPKVFTNWRRYTKNGVKKVKELERDAESIIKENLIIKGNNLLALHSLKAQFAGKVKLIYIDPPYNTGNDSFRYNDRFNHSTWLTFMKNRLEVAKELLREDGVIFVSCDDNEYPYLKVLLDEVFHRDDFENIFHIKVRHEERILRKDIRYQKVLEQLLCYRKTSKYEPARRFISGKRDNDFRRIIKLRARNPHKIEKIGAYQVEIYRRDQYELMASPGDKNALKEYNIRGSLITQKGSASEFYEKYLRARKDKDGLGTLYRVTGMGIKGDGLGYRFIRQPFDEKGRNGFYYQGRPVGSTDKGNPYPNFYDMVSEFNRVADEGGVRFRSGKKPELFIKRIFEIANVGSGDVVLDFFVGSGTSPATAHKLGLQYIGIEQLNYGEDDSIARLKNAIKGDQTGISKSVGWRGGGDFVCLELAKWNEEAKEKILKAENFKELTILFDELYNKYFLNYTIKVKDFREKVIQEAEFKNLPLKKQKTLFVEMLDMNQLYVNYSEREDKKYGLSKDDITLTEKFYNQE